MPHFNVVNGGVHAANCLPSRSSCRSLVVGAVALSNAGSAFMKNLPDTGLPAGQAAAAREIARTGGPTAVKSLPPGAPGSAAHGVAPDALGSGFSTACLVCGAAAAVAATLTAFCMIGIHADRYAENAENAENEVPAPLRPGRDDIPETAPTTQAAPAGGPAGAGPAFTPLNAQQAGGELSATWKQRPHT
ncbi:hypothetical protein [Streptomyces sp. NPDC001292]|uniref:hypothetical protein n=1 Tax=Streptomyces sp. NPDC001292 TaxID=3364558 RepID=UPI0036867E93